MFKTIKEVQAALIARIDVCAAAGIDTTSPAATAWYDADAETVRLKKLFKVYNDAAAYAAFTKMYVGVGCITFAEDALIEAQMDEEML
jgi:hypothetical protein